MCGIFGAINAGITRKEADTILKTIAHRGPDDSAVYENANVLFGHVRLSIQDLSLNGHQPMISDNGDYIIIYNGELYNHWDIRKELEAKGYSFKSTSDTETLLYAYIEYGVDCLQKFNGIFALAIHDKKKNKLFIARDNYGVKPFYYYYDNEKLLFSSEIKALLHIEGLDYSIDPTSFYNYLLFLWSPGQPTPFKKIKKLLPGHYALIDLDNVSHFEPQQYYVVPFNGEYDQLSEEEWIEQLDQKLIQAVDRQLLSDVPVAFFLSGGLDSSLLVAIARKLYPDRLIKGYTIDTGNLADDEGFAEDLPYAKKVAAHLGVELEVIPASIDIVSDFDKMIWYLDEPEADAAPLNVLNIARDARQQGYKVLIGGAAGDDIFSGYRRHRALNLEKYLLSTPQPLRKMAKGITALLPNTITSRKARKLTEDFDKSSIERRIGYFFWLSRDRVEKLFSDKWKPEIKQKDPYAYFENLLLQIPAEDSILNQMLFWEIRSFLVDHNLNYTDKLSMAVGVESRVPFLDKELVDFATRIPPGLKLKGKETKYILKKVAERYLPLDVIYRPKTGFIAPIRKWIKEDMKALIETRLLSVEFNKWGIFDQQEIKQLLEDNESGKIDGAYAIWSLLSIESWLRQFAA